MGMKKRHERSEILIGVCKKKDSYGKEFRGDEMNCGFKREKAHGT